MAGVERTRWNSLGFGLKLGTVALLLTLGIMLVVVSYRVEPGYMWYYLRREGILPRLLSLAALPGAVLFFIAIRTNRTRAARGLLTVTVVCALVVCALQFVH